MMSDMTNRCFKFDETGIADQNQQPQPSIIQSYCWLFVLTTIIIQHYQQSYHIKQPIYRFDTPTLVKKLYI